MPTKNSTNRLWQPSQRPNKETPCSEDILDILRLALRRVPARFGAVGKPNLEVNMVTVERIPIFGRHVRGVDLERFRDLVAVLLSPAGVGQRADGRDASCVRAETQVGNANGVLTTE